MPAKPFLITAAHGTPPSVRARMRRARKTTDMRDYLTLGPTPCEEPCAQVGTADYITKTRAEGSAYIAQLLRQFGEPPGMSFFKLKGFPHEFGTYHEVLITFDDENAEAQQFAYHVENNLPACWDEEALKELRATDYHLSVAHRRPDDDHPNLMAMEPMGHYGPSWAGHANAPQA